MKVTIHMSGGPQFPVWVGELDRVPCVGEEFYAKEISDFACRVIEVLTQIHQPDDRATQAVSYGIVVASPAPVLIETAGR